MEQSDQIQYELNKLEELLEKIEMFSFSKEGARDLIITIEQFNHSFSVNYPLCTKYYLRNHYAEILISEGIADLEVYTMSKLKRKDNPSYEDGKNKIFRGIKSLIMHLQKELNND